MMEQYEKISESIVESLSYSFWENFIESTDDFPDTMDAHIVKEHTLKRLVALLVVQWVLDYPQETRKEELEDFIEKIREFEDKMKNYKRDLFLDE